MSATTQYLEDQINQVSQVVPSPAIGVTISENDLLLKLNELYIYAKSVLGSTNNITAHNVIMLAFNLMHIVEKYNTLTGSQKKMLVLDTIRKLINDNISDELEKQELLIIVNSVLPGTIDTLVSAINGDIKFVKDKVESCFSRVFGKIFGCCKPSSTTTTTASV